MEGATKVQLGPETSRRLFFFFFFFIFFSLSPSGADSLSFPPHGVKPQGVKKEEKQKQEESRREGEGERHKIIERILRESVGEDETRRNIT